MECVAGCVEVRGGGIACVWHEDRDRRHGNGVRDVVIDESWKLNFVCVCVFNLDRPSVLWCHIRVCVCVIHSAAHHLTHREPEVQLGEN